MVAASFEERIGRVLIEDGFMTAEQLDRAKGLVQKSGTSLFNTIVEQQMVSWETLVTVLSFQLHIPVVDLNDVTPDQEAVRLVPRDYAEEQELLPVGFDPDGSLRVATTRPHQLSSLLSQMTGRRIKFVLVIKGDLREVTKQAYGA